MNKAVSAVSFLVLAISVHCAGETPELSGAEALGSRPNIVFLLIDDLGWTDLGCYGSNFYETPNVDRLAAEGMRFTDAYAASPVCSPTRASIMTGKYPARVNFTRATPTESLALEEVTIAESLQEAGYRTAHLGKWHLQINQEEGKKHFPEAQGFDVSVGGGFPGSYFFPYKREKSPTSNFQNMEDGKPGDYLPDALTTKAIRFMEETENQPFFLNLWYYLVHTPIRAPQDKIDKCQQRLQQSGIDKPAGAIKEYDSWNRKRQDHPVYTAMVESMDENVGRILDYLESSGRDRNTIVIFMSDNGGLSTSGVSPGGPTSNLPLRAGKAWVYEGGIREPMIINWPGITEPGSVCKAPVISTDFYPTILEMIGLPKRPQQHIDGISLVPLLKQEKDSLDREALYFHFPHDHKSNSMGASGAIRAGDCKLVERFSNGNVELFNLKNDLGEQNDLSEEMPEMTKKLKTMLHKWRQDVGTWVPSDRPKQAPVKRNG